MRLALVRVCRRIRALRRLRTLRGGPGGRGRREPAPANPPPRTARKSPPGRAGSVRGGGTPAQTRRARSTLPKPPEFDGLAPPLSPANDGRRVHRRRGMNLTNYPPCRAPPITDGECTALARPRNLSAFLAPRCQRKCTAGGGAGRNRRGMSHRARRWPPDRAAAKRRGRGEVHGRTIDGRRGAAPPDGRECGGRHRQTPWGGPGRRGRRRTRSPRTARKSPLDAPRMFGGIIPRPNPPGALYPPKKTRI